MSELTLTLELSHSPLSVQSAGISSAESTEQAVVCAVNVRADGLFWGKQLTRCPAQAAVRHQG